MNTHAPRRRNSTGNAVAVDATPATEDETRAHLLERGNRVAAPVLKSFVQDQDRRKTHRTGPLSVFVRNGDERGLKAFLFLHAFISSGKDGWSATLPLQTWARVFGTTRGAELRSASTAATKLLTRLEQRKLITRVRSGRARMITVTLLKPDGSGRDYGNRPLGASTDDRFFSLSHRFWTEDWHRQLDLPATAMLLVALCEPPGFELVTERMPDWYGWSADTAERGLKTLERHGLLTVDKRVQKAPLAPLGVTTRNVYTLVGALVPDRTRKPAARRPAAGKAARTATRAAAASSTTSRTPKSKTAAGTTVPKTAVPKTAVPKTPVPKTAVPKTAVPKTAVPKTAVPKTAVPKTAVPKTAVPKTAVPKTAVPKTAVPKTAVPKTAVPKTAVPKTAVPKTAVPKTAVPKTAVPKTAVPKTAVPKTAVPKTAVPKTAVPKTAVPKTAVRKTAVRRRSVAHEGAAQ